MPYLFCDQPAAESVRANPGLNSHDVVVRTEALEGCAVESLACIRMCDADDEFRTLLKTLSI